MIHNAHLADVAFHDPDLREHLLQSHNLNRLAALGRTVPGGFLVALMSRDVLDDPRTVVREAVTALGDVLAPSGCRTARCATSPGATTPPT